jgi:hypothetical protein
MDAAIGGKAGTSPLTRNHLPTGGWVKRLVGLNNKPFGNTFRFVFPAGCISRGVNDGGGGEYEAKSGKSAIQSSFPGVGPPAGSPPAGAP